MDNTSPFLGSVCSPPEPKVKKRVFVSKCPECGEGPYIRPIGGLGLCSRRCEAHRESRERARLREQYAHLKLNPLPPTYVSRPMTKKEKRKARQAERRIAARHNEKPKQKSLTALQKKYGISFYTSEEWRNLRYQALQRSKGGCELCGRTKRHGVMLHVDHIKPRSKFPSLELCLGNLQVLCEDCNLGKSNRDETDWR